MPAKAGDVSLIPGSGRFPGEGSGYPLQYSCMENFMDREAWQATVHGVTKSQTLTLSLSFSMLIVTEAILWMRSLRKKEK